MRKKRTKNRVLLIGNSLSVEGMAAMIEGSPAVVVAAKASTVEEALEILETRAIDGLVAAGTDSHAPAAYCEILARYPDLPFIWVDINTDKIQVYSSESVGANPEALLAALSALPQRYFLSDPQSSDAVEPRTPKGGPK